VQAANAELADVLGGRYLSPDSNPYVKDTFDAMARGVVEQGQLGQGNINALFNKSNAFGPGNTAWEETMARYGYGMDRSLSELATNTYGANYQRERQNMQDAMRFAPNLQQANFADTNQMLQAGNLATDLQANNAQNLYNTQATAQQWQQAQGAGMMGLGGVQATDQQGASNAQYGNAMAQYQNPMNVADWYGGTYSGFMGTNPGYRGGQVQLTQPTQSSTLAAGLGGGMLGANLASALIGQRTPTTTQTTIQASPQWEMPQVGGGGITTPSSVFGSSLWNWGL
jgi:hypothetical protein